MDMTIIVLVVALMAALALAWHFFRVTRKLQMEMDIEDSRLANIAENKRSDNHLNQVESFYYSMIANAPMCIQEIDLDGKIISINRASQQLLLPADGQDLIGQSFLQTVDEKDRRRVEKLLDLAKTGKSSQMEFAGAGILHGRTLSSFFVPISLDDGDVKLILAASHDISQHVGMNDELGKLAQVVEQSPQSIIITNTRPEIEYVNKACLESSGYLREELIGRNPSILKSGKTRPKNYLSMWKSLKSGNAWQGEFVNLRKDGSEYTEHASLKPIQNNEGETTHFVAIKEDISQKKKLARELNEHRHNLETLVEKRTIELAEARKKAEAANRAKSSFLANMSHEIRTPMNAIIGLTHLLRRGTPTEEQLDRLKKIDISAGHLLSVINNVLDISKIEAGKLVLEQSDFHLESLFDHVSTIIREQATAKGLSIEVDMNDVPRFLRGDLTRLRQAMLNYANNAVKFTEHGTIFLRAKKLAEFHNETLLRFEVEDTGIGIEPDQLFRLFDAFEQADASTTRAHGGSGLGLAITDHLAQLMGGEVGAESMPDQGSTFWFSALLEHSESAQAVDAEGHYELDPSHSGSRILLVEDNLINRDVTLALLKNSELLIDTAENGRVAVDMARSTVYDLILMDVQMPEMDGLEATRLIRCNRGSAASSCNVPILAMTANIYNEDRQICLQAGMNDFISKPVDRKDLISIIAKWLPRDESAFPEEISEPTA